MLSGVICTSAKCKYFRKFILLFQESQLKYTKITIPKPQQLPATWYYCNSYTLISVVRSLSLSGNPWSSKHVKAGVTLKHSLSALHSLYVISFDLIDGIFLFSIIAFFSVKIKNNYTLTLKVSMLWVQIIMGLANQASISQNQKWKVDRK